MKKDFHIQNIDPLGQGVSKTEGDVTFIKKTLPDESGIAEIITSKKGVTFATLKTLTNKSPDRITPVCSYFEQCNGCDFLHTSYEKEVEFKKFNILRSLKSFGIDDVHFHESRERIGYRNRVQLHFSRSQNKIGYLDVNRKIVNIKNCIIASPLIQKKIKEITERGQW
jgi:23S rRNA (uracil1939-C5)-methyltransferase